jgi:hypothetical protein
MTKDEPSPGPSRDREPRRSFVANVAGKLALVLLAGFGLILLFRGCVAPVLRDEVRDVQQKHHGAPK